MEDGNSFSNDSGVRISEPTDQDKTQDHQGPQGVGRRELLSTKPLHKYVQKEPKTLGVVILVFGSAEFLMGFPLFGDSVPITSNYFYVPFWQGLLFLVCGSLSIYAATHPTKKTVTVCLSMYVVSLIGILFSVGTRMAFLIFLDVSRYRKGFIHAPVEDNRLLMLIAIESALFVSSICVFVLLSFLSNFARLALKSDRTQIVFRQIAAPVTVTQTE